MITIERSILNNAVRNLQGENESPEKLVDRINVIGQMTNFAIARTLRPDPEVLEQTSNALLRAADLVLITSRDESLTTNQRLDALQTYANTVGRSFDIASRSLRERIQQNAL